MDDNQGGRGICYTVSSDGLRDLSMMHKCEHSPRTGRQVRRVTLFVGLRAQRISEWTVFVRREPWTWARMAW